MARGKKNLPLEEQLANITVEIEIRLPQSHWL